MSYVEPKILETYGVATEGTDANIFKQLAEAASRQFDRETEVAEKFFEKAKNEETTKKFRANGISYIRILPFVEAISSVKIAGFEINSDDYFISENYLVFNYQIAENKIIEVTAVWGFAEVPADVKQAVIEQALFLWRKRDLSFADLSGVASSVANAETSQTFAAIAKKYRDLYSTVNFA